MQKFEIIKPEYSDLELPAGGEAVAGFPSPANDFMEERVDLNRLLIKNREATFYVRVRGESMAQDFHDGDLLIVDRSLEWSSNRIALCYVNNDFTLKRLKIENGRCFLVPSNEQFPQMEVNAEQGVTIWGIVTYAIRKL